MLTPHPFLPVIHTRTWKYVQHELPKVPNHIPVLVMANFRDMYENQAVYREEIEYFIKDLDRYSAEDIQYVKK